MVQIFHPNIVVLTIAGILNFTFAWDNITEYDLHKSNEQEKHGYDNYYRRNHIDSASLPRREKRRSPPTKYCNCRPFRRRGPPPSPPDCLAAKDLPIYQAFDHYFYFYNDDTQLMNWTEADQICKSYNMKLFCLEKQIDIIAMLQYIMGVLEFDTDVWYWLGPTPCHEFPKGEMHWEAASERNPNFIDDTNSPCVGLHKADKIVNWAPLDCSRKMRFVCQIFLGCGYQLCTSNCPT